MRASRPIPRERPGDHRETFADRRLSDRADVDRVILVLPLPLVGEEILGIFWSGKYQTAVAVQFSLEEIP